MDSLTQFLLGASVSGALLGPRLGAKALLIGGVVGTLPDLDSFVPMGNAIDDMTHHRGPSHSVLVQTAFAPVIAWAIGRVVPAAGERPWRLLATVWLCLVTHAILDSLTTYGTQILWPLPVDAPAAFSSVFIIDPVYSLLLLAGVLSLFFLRARRARAVAVNRTLLVAATLYLAAGAAGHLIVRAEAAEHPAFTDRRVFVQPTPFNILFWQVLGIDRNSMVVGTVSPWSSCPIDNLETFDRNAEPPPGLEPSASVRRLEWFTDGFFAYQERDGGVRIADLRIGYAPNLVFVFEFARRIDGGYSEIDPVQVDADSPRSEQVADLLADAVESLNGCAA